MPQRSKYMFVSDSAQGGVIRKLREGQEITNELESVSWPIIACIWWGARPATPT